MPSASPEPDDLIRVVVIDADDLVRETVAALLGIGGRIEVVGIAGQAGPAIDLVAAARPEVVVIDPRLPDIDAGLAFIQRLRLAAPAVRILIVCSPDRLERLAQAEGVDRCIRKTFRPDDLTAAIIAASQSTPV
jgi:DNA-binding NarL/FixJ family response regulator